MKATPAILSLLADRRSHDKHAYGYPFITLSRQAGAGGHTLAEAIQRKADEHHYTDLFRGWKVIDRELCEAIAADPRFHASMESLLSEEYHSELQEFISALVGGPDEQYKLYKEMFSALYSLARVGKVILVGRGSNLVTAKFPSGIHIRVVASFETRIARMQQFLGISEVEASAKVVEQDRDRKRMVTSFFGKNIDDPELYDHVWNTDESSIDELAKLAVNLVSEKNLHGES